MATENNVFLAVAQFQTSSNPNLFLNNINPSNHFRHGVLNLDAGIHLNEKEFAIFIKEFESAGTAITNFSTGFGATLTNFGDSAAINTWGWSLFNHFLVATLH